VSQSFAGITVPQGEPGGLRDAASSMIGVSGQLDGVADGLGGLPSQLTMWQGDGSLTYGNACANVQGVVSGGAQTVHSAAVVLRHYAGDLEDAQDEAKAAIREAKDAHDRREKAQTLIDQAVGAKAAAAFAAATAATELTFTSALGTPSAGAQADLDAANGAIARAEYEEAAARRAWDQADMDFKAAQKRGEKAEKAAITAGHQAAGQLEGLAGAHPGVPGVGAPAQPVVQQQEDDGGGGILGWVHHGLDGAGFIPAAGAIPDLINAGIYAGEGDWENALWSTGAAVPLAGDGAKAGKMSKEAIEEGVARAGKHGVDDAAEHADDLVAPLLRVTGDAATDANTWRKRADGGTATLRENLGLPTTAGDHAHHMIPKGAYGSRSAEARQSLEEAQAAMQKFNIGPDDAANGVYLAGGVHAKVHTDEYFRTLASRLSDATNQVEAREILADMADELGRTGRLAP
jgi:uncharacterized protein YukE